MAGKIVVVDYHKGNLSSVVRSVTQMGGDAVISDDPRVIASASGVIVPGVGAFEDAMAYLNESGEAEAILASAERGVPFLGICLGLHLLFERGDERSAKTDGEGQAPSLADADGWVPGLGILSGSATRLQSGRLKVPHVGWDQVHLTEHGRECPLFSGMAEGANVYFTHSYAVAEDVDPQIVATNTHYTRTFASAVWKDNVMGVQFHPEKSSGTGLTIVRNYVEIVKKGGVA